MGLLISFITAWLYAFHAVYVKRVRGHSFLHIAWATDWYTLPVLLVALLISLAFEPVPQLNSEFWKALLVAGTLGAISFPFYIKAISVSQMSLVKPIENLFLVFLLVTSWFINRELPGKVGLAGVLIIGFGAYRLGLNKAGAGFLAPFKALGTDKGVRAMLVFAFCLSIMSPYYKVGIDNSTVMFWGFAFTLYTSLGLTVVVLARQRQQAVKAMKDWQQMAPIGLILAATIIGLMLAVKYTKLVAYAMAVKQTNTLWSVLLAAWIFGEPGLKQRFGSAVIIMVGVVLISLSLF